MERAAPGESVAHAVPDPLEPGVRYALVLLMFVSAFNLLDRQIINILAEPIRQDLSLSDTQLGLLTGFAFALFYTLVSLPIARLIDAPRSNRIGILSASLALWSGLTTVCAFASHFWHLLLARIGVGVGEAGCVPAAHSLIGDMVPEGRRASALAFFGIGVPIGSMLGMAGGGLIADHFGWRMAFVAAGIPGLVLALVMLLTVREPRRQQLDSMPSAARTTDLWRGLRELSTSSAFVLIAVAASMVSLLSQGKTIWGAVMLIRLHDLTPGEVGLWLGLMNGTAGAAGMWLGGKLADIYGSSNPLHYLTLPAAGTLISAPLLFFGYMSGNWIHVISLLWFPTLCNALSYGPMFACVQRLVPPGRRAVAVAIILFGQNLIGLGFGPLLFGTLSDLLTPYAGAESVRWVLMGSAALTLMNAWVFWQARERLARELS